MQKTKYAEIEENLLEIASYTQDLAKAFEITGNDKMYKAMQFITHELKKDVKKLQEATMEDLNQRLDEVQQSGAAILEACLHYEKKL